MERFLSGKCMNVGRLTGYACLFLFFVLVGRGLAQAGDGSLSWKRDVAIRLGYGAARNTEDVVEFGAIFPSVRWRFFHTHLSNGAYLNLSTAGEGVLLKYFRPEGAVGLGVTPWIRVDVEYKSAIPYFQAGLGGIWTNLDIYELGQEFNFTPQAELGLEYAFSDKFHLNLAVRYQHISNAGLNKNNHGVDSVIGLAGISFPF